ncbi:NUDIX hydrolase [Bacillus spongiae]|uniref:NUDIX hydrolase n=1 Tax=Bacillus spongiae TaxID=2683610 RepID=A0ABU8HFH1_9BACI
MNGNNHVKSEDALREYNVNEFVTPDGYTSDIAIFTITSEKKQEYKPPIMELKIMLIKRALVNAEEKPNIEGGKWALPGGFVSHNEAGGYDAALRELAEETGVKGLHLKHFGVYDKPGRDPRGWIISNAHYAIVPERYLANRKAADDAIEVELFTLKEVFSLSLSFDHMKIIEDAIKIIKRDIAETTVAKHFLPKEFTASELRVLLQLVINEPVVKEDSAFSRKIGKLPFIEVVKQRDGSLKKSQRNSKTPSQLYKFKDINEEEFVRSIYSAKY